MFIIIQVVRLSGLPVIKGCSGCVNRENSCNLKAVKEGTVLISAQNGNMRETFTVVVASGNDYINKWIQNIVKEVRLAANDRERQLLLVSQYIVSNFTYDNILI